MSGIFSIHNKKKGKNKISKPLHIVKEIVKVLMPIVPTEWKKIFLCAEIDEGYYSIFYYCKLTELDKPIKCYDLQKSYAITDEMLDVAFKKIYENLKPEWDQTKEKGNGFSHYTLIIDKDFNFNEYFEYPDSSVTENDNYEENWKKKYLVL